jgi:hypothetical protein
MRSRFWVSLATRLTQPPTPTCSSNTNSLKAACSAFVISIRLDRLCHQRSRQLSTGAKPYYPLDQSTTSAKKEMICFLFSSIQAIHSNHMSLI